MSATHGGQDCSTILRDVTPTILGPELGGKYESWKCFLLGRCSVVLFRAFRPGIENRGREEENENDIKG